MAKMLSLLDCDHDSVLESAADGPSARRGRDSTTSIDRSASDSQSLVHGVRNLLSLGAVAPSVGVSYPCGRDLGIGPNAAQLESSESFRPSNRRVFHLADLAVSSFFHGQPRIGGDGGGDGDDRRIRRHGGDGGGGGAGYLQICASLHLPLP